MHPYRVLIGIGIVAAIAAILTRCFVKKARARSSFLAFVPAHLILSILSLPLGGVLMAFRSNLSAGEFILGLACAALHLPLTIPVLFLVGSDMGLVFLWVVIPLNSLTAGFILASVRAPSSGQCASPAGVPPWPAGVGNVLEESQNKWIARRVCELEARDSAKRGGSAPKSEA
jgi:hypothetical protein